jgi:hypothetical protein
MNAEDELNGMEETVQDRSKPSRNDGKQRQTRDRAASAATSREHDAARRGPFQAAATAESGILRELDQEQRHIE